MRSPPMTASRKCADAMKTKKEPGAKFLDQKGCDNGRGNGANGKVEQQSSGELDPFVAGGKVMGMGGGN